MALPNYSVLDNGLYELNRCELMDRLPGTQHLFGMGDGEAGTLNVNSTKLARFRKNARTRTKAKEIVTQTDSTISLTLMQRTEFLSGLMAMGAIKPVAQVAAEDSTYTIDHVKVGGRYFLEKQDVSNVALSDESSATWTLGTHFTVADSAMGVIEVIALPTGVAEDDEVTATFDVAASPEGLNEAVIASKTEFTVELFIRELSEYAKPRFYRLYEVSFTMDGDVPLIGGDEFAQWTITGSALDQGGGKGVGLMRELSE